MMFIKSPYPLPKKGSALFLRSTDYSATMSTGSSIPIFETSNYNDDVSNIIQVSTTQIRLKANFKYRLGAGITVITDSNAASNGEYQFYNVTSSSYVGAKGHIAPYAFSNDYSGSTSQAILIISPTTDTVIELRFVRLVNSVIALSSLGSSVMVEELEAYLPQSTGTQRVTGDSYIYGNSYVSGNLSVNNLTTGSIPFSISGTLSQDNSNLFWDNTNKRLGIGTKTPSASLNIINQTANNAQITLNAYSDVNDTEIVGLRARGTLTSPSATQNGDSLFTVKGAGYGATSLTGSRVGINFYAAENWNDSAQGAYITFDTTGIGTTAKTERMKITSDGLVTIRNYTQLGSDAPSIKMKKLTGTTASTQGGVANIAHGVTASKIISTTVQVNTTSNDEFVLPGFTSIGGYQFNVNTNSSNVKITNLSANSANILSKPCIVTIFYIA